MRTLQPEGWAAPHGYANGIAAGGESIFIAGQIGWDPATGEIVSEDFAAQTRQALANVAAVLAAGGATPADVVRLVWYVTDRQAYLDTQREIGGVYREIFGVHYPAMSVVVVAGLLEPGAKVEIEATAVLPA
jgi:enamine deaminase RidA (YjgF/YER057c/UK114 family)